MRGCPRFLGHPLLYICIQNFKCQTKNIKIMDALFMIYIIMVVVVFVKDEFKDEDNSVENKCVNNCE